MNRSAFYAALRRRASGVFGTSISQRQVRGIEGILDAFATHGDGRAKTLAYALATAYPETARRMVPVRSRTFMHSPAVIRLCDGVSTKSAFGDIVTPSTSYKCVMQ